LIEEPKINVLHTKKRVLVAPLDWGLGHATRCIPIVQQLLANDNEVLLAGENATASVLKQHFPELEILALKGYDVKYSQTKFWFWFKMVSQIPKIKAAIKYENKWLEERIELHKIDIVISDNRYGLYSSKVPCYFITHQLQILTGFKTLNDLIQKINYSYIQKFTTCWVPDNKGSESLAGKLSNPKNLHTIPVKFIGAISRLQKIETEILYDVAIILSGPEPQRSILENIILKQIANTSLRIILVRGLPLAANNMAVENKHISIKNYLSSNELNKTINASKFIVARSGYSTVMDLAKLQKPALLIPTPGQTEQEYLAQYLANKNYCIAAKQSTLNVLEEINKGLQMKMNSYPLINNNLQAILSEV
jgi:uncharacterized protein (TIGR00661 family)